jgi:dihydropyrimidine dehydrogenase (NAD+) subunit PreT
MKYDLPEHRLEQKLPEKKPLYSEAEAVAEANRCLYCADAPCIKACPTGIDIPTFIRKIATTNVKGSARTIFENNLLGYSCARVCPVEVLCAGDCVYNQWGRDPIQIGRLQRYATFEALKKDPQLVARTKRPATGKRIALIGAGPASLAAAGHLALDGHSCVIFEQKKIPGGLNSLGIAPYKLQAEDSLVEIDFIKQLGDVEIRCGISVVEKATNDSEIAGSELLASFDAVFIGIGLGPDNNLAIPGEDGPGVEGATAWIERLKSDANLNLDGLQRVLVIGGGNTAIDVARELALLGVPEVSMVYRRDAKAMSGYHHEMDGARREGVRLLENRQPTAVVRDGKTNKVIALRVAPLENGKASKGAEEEIPCDWIALAIGQSRLTALAKAFPGVELDERGRVKVDDASCQTGNSNVYAGGDCVNGGKEVVNAAQHGKLAARAISASLAPKS